MVNELTTSREESGARSDYPEARTDGAARGEPNEFELSRVVTEVDKRSRKKTIVNRRTSECRALISSCLGKRPEVERRVDSSWTSQAAKPSGEFRDSRAKRKCRVDSSWTSEAAEPSGELRDSFKVDS